MHRHGFLHIALNDTRLLLRHTRKFVPRELNPSKRETHAFGLNKIGLERRSFSREQLKALQHAYRLFLAAKLNTSQAIERLKSEGLVTEDVTYLVEFVEQSQRGVLK